MVKRTALIGAGIGFLAGMAIGVFIVVIIGFANGGQLVLPPVLLSATGSEAGALLAQMLVSGAFGAIPMAGVAFYRIDSWGLLKQAIVHFATYTVAFVIIGLGVGWIEPIPFDIAVVVGVFAICHAIIWFIMYSRYRAEAKELSMLLQKAKQSV